jgi:hypothetical protein
MKRILSSALIALALAGCGGGSSPLSHFKPPVTAPPPTTPPVPTAIEVTCPTPVASGASVTCSATITPSDADQSVVWSAVSGSITPKGVYTAPMVTKDSPETVTAVSVAAQSVMGASVFTITAPVAPPPPPPVKTSGPIKISSVGENIVTRVESNGTIDVAFDTGSGIAVSRSTDDGATFSEPLIAVASTGINDGFKFLLDSQNKMYILSYSLPGNSDETIATLTVGDGKTFVSNVTPSNGFSPGFAIDSKGIVDLLWLDSGTSDLHSRMTADGGKTFSPDRILWAANGKDSIDLTVTGGTRDEVYVIWGVEEDLACQVLFTVSFDGGLDWEGESLEITPKDGGCYVAPNPKLDGMGKLNVAFIGDGSSVGFTQSADRGQTFTAPIIVVSNQIELNTVDFGTGPNGELDFVFDAAAIGDNFDVFFTQSLDGQTFSAPLRLNLPTVQNFTGGGDPSIGTDAQGKITVAWADDGNGKFSGDNDIYLSTATDANNFSAPANLTNTSDQIETFPLLTESSKAVLLTWFDAANSTEPDAGQGIFFEVLP